MEIREMTIRDYEAVNSLWQICDGIGLDSDVDSKRGMATYLQRNPGMSFVAIDNGKIFGAVICGHDGRRGYLNHLAVAKDFRLKGTGRALVYKALGKLRAIGIRKCNGFVLADNRSALEFWQKLGFLKQEDLKVISKIITL